MTLTRRAVLMEAQVDVLEGKRKALARHRAALASLADRLEGVTVPEDGDGGPDRRRAPALSRVVLSAQEDLRRDIARAMHDGPAQCLTNIVLQAQIVERLLDRDPAAGPRGGGALIAMVQRTLEATKTFIFDVRPMVLDDLGLVPTLRRSARDRSRRAQVPVEFESAGTDRRLSMDVESAVFRVLTRPSRTSRRPERVLLRLDWGEELEAPWPRTGPRPPGDGPLPRCRPATCQTPSADDPGPPRRARRRVVAAERRRSWSCRPPARDAERAGSVGARVEIAAEAASAAASLPLPPADEEAGRGP